jgi:hypothetical protein
MVFEEINCDYSCERYSFFKEESKGSSCSFSLTDIFLNPTEFFEKM